MKDAPFSRSALVLLFACATALFALSVLLHAYDGSPSLSGSRTGPNSFSISAIGHAGLHDLFQRMGFRTERGLGDVLSPGRRAVLIVAEPDLGRVSSEDGLALTSAPRLLLVLPKWRGEQDKKRPSWIGGSEPVPLHTARRTLDLVSGRDDVLRAPWPQAWKFNELGVTPTGKGIVQLLRSQTMRPVVGNEEGILVGELEDKKGASKIWVLADPDVMSNHGLTKGDNSPFMLALIRKLAGNGRISVIFDESLHGFRAAKTTPVTLLFRFPFVLVTALVCAAAGLLVWAGAGRFGAPIRPRPELDFGKRRLIDNSVALLDYAGHHDLVLKRYLRMLLRETGRALHAPSGLDEPGLAAWLDRIGRARGVKGSCAEILGKTDNLKPGEARYWDRLMEHAGDLHRWKGDILHGSATDRLHR